MNFFGLGCIIMDGVMRIHYDHGRFNIYRVKLLNLMKKIFRQLFYVIQKLGSITLRASVGGHALAPETWSKPGQYVYRRELGADMIAPGPLQINFSLNKSIPPTAQDQRELGIVVQELSIEPL